jgi:hypothetical protein
VTINHLLIHREFTSKIWHLVLILFGVSWDMPSNILELLCCWKTRGWGYSKEVIWNFFLISYPRIVNVEHLEREIGTYLRIASLMYHV